MFSVPLRWLLLGSIAVVLGMVSPVRPQQRPPPRPAIRLEAVAETKLLMEGLLDPNFRGLEKRLGEKPAEAETWTIVRGQALLVAEGGNLLMLRPPRNFGQEVWMSRATDLRAAAARLARAASAKDYLRCRTGMGDVASACNRCHQTFRVPLRIKPFQPEAPQRKVSLP